MALFRHSYRIGRDILRQSRLHGDSNGVAGSVSGVVSAADAAILPCPIVNPIFCAIVSGWLPINPSVEIEALIAFGSLAISVAASIVLTSIFNQSPPLIPAHLSSPLFFCSASQSTSLSFPFSFPPPFSLSPPPPPSSLHSSFFLTPPSSPLPPYYFSPFSYNYSLIASPRLQRQIALRVVSLLRLRWSGRWP